MRRNCKRGISLPLLTGVVYFFGFVLILYEVNFGIEGLRPGQYRFLQVPVVALSPTLLK